MLKINIPNNFIPERKYILDIVFEDFLGLDYFITTTPDSDEYKITLDSKKVLIIKDYFFAKYNEKKSYLSVNNIPNKITFSKNQFINNHDIVILYGEDNIEISETAIVCHIDIFAATFFMLTRWEEYVTEKKDKYNRFPDDQATVQKFNIHKRPIVNEYIEFLWKMIKFLGTKQQRREFTYTPKLSHDIDAIAVFDTFFKYFKTVVSDVVKRKSLLLPFKTTRDYINIKNGTCKDYYDTFDFLMEVSEKYNIKSHFYFMAGLIGEKDVKYDINDIYVENLIRKIIKRGHKIGIHSTYDAYNKPNIFKTEKLRLENIYPHITEGRQHFLRFETPITWQIWDDNSMLIDSTMAYANSGGFRCGTCYEFNVFNILTRKKLNLLEQPLIAMDTAIQRSTTNKEDFYNEFANLIETTKKYKGNFVMLWHNSNFNVHNWKGYENIYSEIIKIL